MADYFSQYEDDKKKKASQVASQTEKAKLSTPDFFTTYEKTAKPIVNREPELIKPEVKKPNPIVQGVKNIVKKITTPTTVQNTSLTPQAGPSPVAKVETIQSTVPSLFDSIKSMPTPIQDDWNLKNDERLQRIKNGTATPMETIGAFLNKSIDVVIGQEYDPQGKKIAPKKVVGGFLEDAMNAMAIGGFGGPQITGIASNAMTGVNTVIDPTIKYGFSLVRGLKTGATFTAIGSIVSSLQERDITVKDSLTSFGLGMILGLHGPVEMKGVATEDLTASKLLLKDYGITAKDLSNPEILKTKWRDNMMKLHPDKGGNAQEFQAFTDAYNKVTSAGVNSKWSMPDINEWFNHLWDKKGMSEKEATAKADKQFKLAIESKASQNTTGSAPTNVMTPEQALVQIEGSNLKGTPAGTKITEVINKAQSEGKNIQFNVTGAGDVKVVTPGGTNLGMKIVDTQLPVLTTTNPDGTVETINQPVQRQVIKIEKPVGVKTASVMVRGDEAGMTLQIDKEARGQGLGTKMVSTMENKAQETGAKKIVIDASSVANGDAWDNSVGFWEKQGYATVPGAVETNGMIKMEKVLGTTEKPKISNQLVDEAKKYKSAEDFFLYSRIGKDLLREQGIKSQENIKTYWDTNIKDLVGKPKLETLNPTGTVLADYNPQSRATMELGKNITTLDRTMKVSPDTEITIYRGAPASQKSINPGDYITTNKDLAKSYNGDGNVISMKVKASEVLDDKTEPLGEEYIYRPKKAAPKIDRTKLVGRNLSKPNSVLLGEQKPTTPAEVPVVDNKAAIAEANKKLGDYYMKAGEDNPDALGQAWQEVMMQLEVAEPGQRLFTADGEFSGSVSSTFPNFIPEELRNTELFNSVLDGIKDPTNMVYPPNTQPRKQALYDAILGEIDSRAGLDSSGIINEIRSLYEKGKAKPKEVTSGSATGSQKPEIPAEKVIPPKKEAVPKSDTPTSRLQERIQEQLLEIDQGRYEFDPKSGTYNKLNLEADAQKATYFLQTDPKEALDVAMGYADAPIGQTANAISLAVAFKARAEGNYELWKDIITRTSLRNTKFGQEIVSLRGHFNNDTPENYIKKVLDARMDLLGRNMITDAQKSLGKNKRSAKVNAVEKIDRETDKLVDKVNEPIKSKKVTDRIKMAQDIIDSLICK